MSDPASFTSTTPRHALPFLFAGQAQKEFTVNEALARIDLLLQPAIVATVNSAPATPVAGDCYLVGDDASGLFAGREGNLAGWDGQQWTFLVPSDGMTVRETGTNTVLLHAAGWQRPPSLTAPAGGAVVDAEARGAIVALFDALKAAGIIS